MRALPRALSTVAALLVPVLLGPAAGAEERVVVPGASVSLEPPAMLALSPDLPGFLWDGMGASIAVNRFPVSFAEVQRALTRDALEREGLHWVGGTREALGTRPALLVQARQAAADVWFEKWLLLFADENGSVLVAATYPESLGPLLREPMRRALHSTRSESGPGSL
jgi:hypothetical protein